VRDIMLVEEVVRRAVSRLLPSPGTPERWFASGIIFRGGTVGQLEPACPCTKCLGGLEEGGYQRQGNEQCEGQRAIIGGARLAGGGRPGRHRLSPPASAAHTSAPGHAKTCPAPVMCSIS
jgi:hypothetical protein